MTIRKRVTLIALIIGILVSISPNASIQHTDCIVKFTSVPCAEFYSNRNR